MLRQFTVDEILDICKTAPTVRLKSGEFLFHEGQDAHALYVVQSGSVRVVSGSMVYETVRTGGIVGEMALIILTCRGVPVSLLARAPNWQKSMKRRF